MGKVQAVGDGVKAGAGARARLPRPGECRDLMRERLAKEFDGIMDGFIAAAKKGSCPHVKLATELLREGESRAKAKKGSARLLMEKLDREEAERARERV
jgi:hypothetical protein